MSDTAAMSDTTARLGTSQARAAGYRGPQVCKIVGITYRQLDYWARTDLLRPSISDARGSGTQREYSYSDLLQLKVIKGLLDAGVDLKRARQAIECLRSTGADVATASLVVNSADSVLAASDEEVIDLLKGGQGVFNMVVDMTGVVSEVEAGITRLGQPAGGAGPAGSQELAPAPSGSGAAAPASRRRTRAAGS